MQSEVIKILIIYSEDDSRPVQKLSKRLKDMRYAITVREMPLYPDDTWFAGLSSEIVYADALILFAGESGKTAENAGKVIVFVESMMNWDQKLPMIVTRYDTNFAFDKDRWEILERGDPGWPDTIRRLVNNRSAPKDPARPDQQYWFLKINPDTWPVDEFTIGYKAFFHTHNLQARPRIDYDLFFRAREGDQIVGFAVGERKTIECLFEVTAGVHVDGKLGEGLSIVLTQLIRPAISLTRFADKLPFADKLKEGNPERLFLIGKSLYDTLLKAGESVGLPQRFYIDSYTTEGNHNDKTDQLSFSDDIESLGTVMCLQKVQPPLAIGLFAKWGAGKSFFMEKLIEYISNLALSNDDRYVNYVVQVKFNSWHYSDANLWASLITKIFESLEAYANDNGQGNEVDKLSSTLQLTSIQKEQTEKKTIELQEQVKELKIKQQEKWDRLKAVSGLKLLKLAANDPQIKSDLSKLGIDGLKELFDDQEKLNRYIKETRSMGTRLKLFLHELKSLSGKRSSWILIFALLAAAAVYFIKTELIIQISVWSGAFVGFIGKMVSVIRTVDNTLKNTEERLRSLKKTINARAALNDTELTEQENELKVLTQSLADIDQKIKTATKQIADLSSGKKLLEFIDNRARDENYARQLGLIAWVRKDFETLDQLLRQQHQLEVETKGTLANPNDVRLRIDRVILYIDDLDRCNEDIVVRVLEAIHLLLAFPLFVVVVGVDPRWLNNALNKKYDGLFKPSNSVDDLQQPITSYDYLEKIFQVPFALKPVTTDDRQNLLSYLTRDEMEAIEAEPITKEQPPSDDRPEHDSHQLIKEKPEGNISPVRPAAIILNKLNFLPDELRYMKEISGMFGQTPRMINRYINVYRIIKSHRSYHVDETPTPSDYRSTLLVLAIITGCPAHAQEFTEALLKSKETDMANFIRSLKHPVLKKFIKLHTTADTLKSLNTNIVKLNLPLIRRFSFRTHIPD